jgi:hypothetical protein
MKKGVMIALLAVLGEVLVTRLVAVPVMEEAEARSDTTSDRNKGQQGKSKVEGNVKGAMEISMIPAADRSRN